MTAMKEQRFWAIIDGTLKHKADPEVQLAVLRTALEALSLEEVESFELRFGELMERSYTWDLWAACYIIHGGSSDDSFDYFRHWLISRGHEVFETAVDTPDALADMELSTIEDVCEFEDFSYVASQVWHRRKASTRTIPTLRSHSAEPPAAIPRASHSMRTRVICRSACRNCGSATAKTRWGDARRPRLP
ncbi:MAG: DUF4240 domain-containing protein [Hyphomicrobiaceae bacterium]